VKKETSTERERGRERESNRKNMIIRECYKNTKIEKEEYRKRTR